MKTVSKFNAFQSHNLRQVSALVRLYNAVRPCDDSRAELRAVPDGYMISISGLRRGHFAVQVWCEEWARVFSERKAGSGSK